MLLANTPVVGYLLLARSFSDSTVQYVSSSNNYQEVYDNVVVDKIKGGDNFGTVQCCSSLNKHITINVVTASTLHVIYFLAMLCVKRDCKLWLFINSLLIHFVLTNGSSQEWPKI
jgi:hypothetical protein